MNKLELEEVYNETLNYVGKKNARRYNLKTVNNLIVHFNEIEEDSKEIVYNELYNYLIFIRDLKPIGIDRESKHESNELYKTFIASLIKYYIPLGFKANFSWLVFGFIAVFSTPILIVLNCSIYCYIALYLLLVTLKAWSWLKAMQHKIYGPLY